MRRCKGTYFKDGEQISFENALFHAWGYELTESEDAVNYSVGIVELANGSVVIVMPESIQFMDRQEALNKTILE